MEKTYSDSESIHCPKCGSTNIIGGKHGFSAGKAIGGALLTGGIGVLAGLHGAKKIELSCLKCGNTFKPAGAAKPVEPLDPSVDKDLNQVGFVALLVLIAIAAFLYFF